MWLVCYHPKWPSLHAFDLSSISLQKRFDVPEKATWEDYLALAFPEDLVKEEPVDLTSMDLMSGKNPMPVSSIHSLTAQTQNLLEMRLSTSKWVDSKAQGCELPRLDNLKPSTE